jgi:chromosome segregation ATPase
MYLVIEFFLNSNYPSLTGSDSSSAATSSRSNSVGSLSKGSELVRGKLDGKGHDSDDSSIKTNLEEIVEAMSNIDEEIGERSFDTTRTGTRRTKESVRGAETDSVSTTSASSGNTALDLERKVRQLKSELSQKRSEAEKLRLTLKAKEKNKLKEKEELLRKKISSYDHLIDKIKTALDVEQNQLNIKNKEVVELGWGAFCHTEMIKNTQ